MKKITITIYEKGDPTAYPIRKRGSKYEPVYEYIADNIENMDWMILEGFENILITTALRNGIIKRFPGYTVRLYKYDNDGKISPRIYIKKQEEK